MRPLGIALIFFGLSVSSLALEISTLDAMPFRFEVNRGQADASSKFLARGRGFSLALTTAGMFCPWTARLSELGLSARAVTFGLSRPNFRRRARTTSSETIRSIGLPTFHLTGACCI